MKGKRNSILALFLALLLAGCGPARAVGNGLGAFILLEGRNPGYYEELSPQKGLSFHIPEGMEAGGRSRNLILSVERYMNHDGFSTAVNEDGSVTVSGVNNEKRVYLKIAGSVFLEAGEYVLSDGGVSSANGDWFLAVTRDNRGLASLPDNDTFSLAEPCEVDVFVAVEAGALLDELTFYPEISRKDEADDVYDPCPDTVLGASGSGRMALMFRTDREALKGLSEDDRILFDNNLAYIYKGRYEWVSLRFKDGTGVQIVGCDPNQALYGKMDIYGRVYEGL